MIRFLASALSRRNSVLSLPIASATDKRAIMLVMAVFVPGVDFVNISKTVHLKAFSLEMNGLRGRDKVQRLYPRSKKKDGVIAERTDRGRLVCGRNEGMDVAVVERTANGRRRHPSLHPTEHSISSHASLRICSRQHPHAQSGRTERIWRGVTVLWSIIALVALKQSPHISLVCSLGMKAVLRTLFSK